MLEIFLRIFIFLGIRVVEAVCFLRSIPYYFQKPKHCPPITDNVLLQSATSLAEKIRKKEITSEAIVKAYISRIEAVNPILNAVVEDRFEAAIQEAKRVDTLISNTKLTEDELAQRYPLLGLPITIKGSIAVAGQSFCAGRVSLAGRKASKDADVVRLCKEAGAIPLLVSNTPEMCMNFETINKVTGITCNPYDTRRTCGGSSGGEGALLGAGASLIGIGSDIFGSVRLPAHYCGVWGHKPSPYAVSVDGHYPSCPHEDSWNKVFNLGPMARYVSDLVLLYKVIMEKKFHTLLNISEKVNIKNVKFFYMEDDGGSLLTHSIDKDVKNALERLTRRLKFEYGCQVQQIKLKRFKSAVELAFVKILAIDDVENLFINGDGSVEELLRFVTCKSQSTFVPIIYGIMRKIYLSVPVTATKIINKQLAQLKKELQAILGDDGVLLIPCHGESADFHGKTYGRIFDFSYTGIFNCIGFPATSCPVGLDSKRLPIGIQAIAAPNNDKLTLTVAQEIENMFGGWIPPPS